MMHQSFAYHKTMKRMWLVVSAVQLLSLTGSVAGSSRACQSQPNCTMCLRIPGCAWCKQREFLQTGESNERRCDTVEALEKRQCARNNVINPSPGIDPLKDKELHNDPENVVQLRPQHLKAKLRVGVPEILTVTFKRAEGYPIDLYYLMDLSYSMKDDLEKIKTLGQEILSSLLKVTSKVRIGFGSFVDKVVMPYISTVKAKLANPCPKRMDTCQPAFSFRNVLRLTDNAEEFKARVSEQKISGNLDSPEGGFDAMMQAAVCQREIGWGNVTRILVYTSDDTFHIAGDGGLAGIYQPNDGKCHLKEDGLYDQGNFYDYPSIGHLSHVLSENNIQLIFAVTEKSIPTYKALSELIPQSVVGELKTDSSNVVQLISEAYGNLSSTIILEHHAAPPGVDISFTSTCAEAESGIWHEKGQCHHVKLNQEVKFHVKLTASVCLSKEESFFIKAQGISEMLRITVKTLCDCDCKDPEDSSDCSSSGKLECGVCNCYSGFLGQDCECRDGSAMELSCHNTNTSQMCSGVGNCECGRCNCQGLFYGNFCQCNNYTCEHHNGLMCGGHGDCICGDCKCQSNYEGSACQCQKQNDTCTCSHHGTCKCNHCHCEEGFFGEQCSEMVAPCETFYDCVACKLKKDNESNSDCKRLCTNVTLVRASDPTLLKCHRDAIHFTVDLDKNSPNIQISYSELSATVDMTSAIAGGALSGIVLIGIAVIILYRVILEVYYRREYRRFLVEQQNVQWKNMQNPLFKDATTTVFNPLHEND